jgi:hypothetical protein
MRREEFAEDLSPLLLKDALSERQKYWQRELSASMV